MSYRTSGLTLARWIQIQREAKINRERATSGDSEIEDRPTNVDGANILQIKRGEEEKAVACPPIRQLDSRPEPYEQHRRALVKRPEEDDESNNIYSPVKRQERPREQNIPAYATLTHQHSLNSRDSFHHNATPPIDQKTESLVGHHQSPRPNPDENEVVGYRKTLRIGMDEDWIEQRNSRKQMEVDQTVGFKKTMRLEEEKWHENGQAKSTEQQHGRIILEPINQDTQRDQEEVHQSTQVVETSKSTEEAALQKGMRRESQVIQVKERELNKQRSRDTLANVKKTGDNLIEVQETKAACVNLTKDRSNEENPEIVEKKAKKKKKKKKVKPESKEEEEEALSIAASVPHIKSTKNSETSEIKENTVNETKEKIKEKKPKKKKSEKPRKMSKSSDDTESLIQDSPKESEPKQEKPSTEANKAIDNDTSFMKFLESKLDNDLNALTSGDSVTNTNPDMQSKLDQILSPEFQSQMDAFLSGSSYDNSLMDNFNSIIK